MNENFILTIDDVFSKQECEILINSCLEHVIFDKNINFSYCEIDVISFPFLFKLNNNINLYIKKYPEINMTYSYWQLNHLRFKFFKKSESFVNWHSEHSMDSPYRILALQIYLTEHNCGTQFYYNKKTILSKIGRVCMFPAYFTHTHKGQPDFDKDRMIITGYYSFTKKDKNE